MSTDDYRWNVSQIATASGLHRDTVRKRITEAGIKPAGKKGNAPTYHLADAMQAIFASHQISVSSHNPDNMAPKDRLDWYKSESERVKFGREVRDLIPVPEVRDELAEVLKMAVGWAESLPDQMERKRIFTPEQLEALEATCDELRDQFYQMLIEAE